MTSYHKLLTPCTCMLRSAVATVSTMMKNTPTSATEIDSFFQGILTWCSNTGPLLIAFLFGFFVSQTFGRPIMTALFQERAQMISRIGSVVICGALVYALITMAQGI
jgi:hypothetical protein